MQVDYIVHSVEQGDVETVAEVNGTSMVVKVPGLVVEMVAAQGNMGHMFRLVPSDMEAALALYVVGAKITSTHSAA